MSQLIEAQEKAQCFILEYIELCRKHQFHIGIASGHLMAVYPLDEDELRVDMLQAYQNELEYSIKDWPADG